MRNQNFKGIIINKRQFMESDMFLTVLTDSGEKFELLAKGASGRSRRKHHLELMNQIEGTFYEGKTHYYLQSVQCKQSFIHLKEDLQLILRMHMILEIINKTVMLEDPHPEIYQLLEETLNSLNQKNVYELTPEITLIKLAHLLGFLPNFKECSSCHKLLTKDEAKWDQEQGTIQCQNCSSELCEHMPLKYRKALDFFRRAPRSEYIKVTLNPEESHEIKSMLPNLFIKHLGAPLKSLALF
jgi:DNA repair protein RecO (recombination protein O)